MRASLAPRAIRTSPWSSCARPPRAPAARRRAPRPSRSRSGPQRQKSAATFTWNGEQSLGSMNALPAAPSPPPAKGSMQGLFASVVTAAARDNKATGHLARANSFGGAAMRTHESDLPTVPARVLPPLQGVAAVPLPVGARGDAHRRLLGTLPVAGPALVPRDRAALPDPPRPRRPPRPLPLVKVEPEHRALGQQHHLRRLAGAPPPRHAPPRHAPLPAHTSTNPAASLFTTSRGSRSPTGSRSNILPGEASPAMSATALPPLAQVELPAHTRTPSAARPAPTLA